MSGSSLRTPCPRSPTPAARSLALIWCVGADLGPRLRYHRGCNGGWRERRDPRCRDRGKAGDGPERQSRRTPLGPGVRVRDHAGRHAALERAHLAGFWALDAGARARVVGVVGVRVGRQRGGCGVARLPADPSRRAGPDLRQRPRDPPRLRGARDAVRPHLRGRPLHAPWPLCPLRAPGPCFVGGDRRLFADRDRGDDSARRRIAACAVVADRPVGERGRHRLRGPPADPRAAAGAAGGRGSPLRRPLRSVHHHLSRRVDHRNRIRRDARANQHRARRAGRAGAADHDRALVDLLRKDRRGRRGTSARSPGAGDRRLRRLRLHPPRARRGDHHLRNRDAARLPDR